MRRVSPCVLPLSGRTIPGTGSGPTGTRTGSSTGTASCAGCIAGVNAPPIKKEDRQYRRPLGLRPEGYPSLSDLGLWKDGVSEISDDRRTAAVAANRDAINAARLSRNPASMGSVTGRGPVTMSFRADQNVSYLTNYLYSFGVTEQIAPVLCQRQDT